MSQSLVELTFTLAAHYHRGFPLTAAVERMARNYLAQEVHDPVLRDKLTPHYALGCKRPSFHNEYLATFNRDNVALETTPIERITESGIVHRETATEHPIDVLVLATGFKVFDPGNMPAYPVSGREGLDLQTSGTRTATRPTRASASRASRTTSRCSAPTATTARPTSTSSRPRRATSCAA